jgi:hypothetical protein
VTGTRLILSALAAVLLAAPAAAGGLLPRKKTDAAKVKQLTETLRSDADEKKRKAAAVELREYDPRTHPELLAAAVAALQKDPSPAVRAEAAETIGQCRLVNPVAGLALEAAADADPARTVRDAAQQALWEYHLSGYRSARGADGFVGQTPEPPLARRPAPRVAVTVTSPVRPAASTAPEVAPAPSSVPAPDPRVPSVMPEYSVWSSPVEAVPALPPPEPLIPLTLPVVVLVTAVPPPLLNVTAEPPLARPLPPLPVRPLSPSPLDLGPTVEPPTAPTPEPTAPLGLPPIPTSLPPPVKK